MRTTSGACTACVRALVKGQRGDSGRAHLWDRNCCDCGYLLHLISLLGGAAAEAGGRIGVRLGQRPQWEGPLPAKQGLW